MIWCCQQLFAPLISCQPCNAINKIPSSLLPKWNHGMSRKTNIHLLHSFYRHEGCRNFASPFNIVYLVCLQQLQPKCKLEMKTEDSLSKVYTFLLNDQAIARQPHAPLSSSLGSKNYWHEGIGITKWSGTKMSWSLTKNYILQLPVVLQPSTCDSMSFL